MITPYRGSTIHIYPNNLLIIDYCFREFRIYKYQIESILGHHIRVVGTLGKCLKNGLPECL